MTGSRIEKLLRKELRKLHLKVGQTYFLIDTGRLEVAVLLTLLETIFEGRITWKLLLRTTRKKKGLFLPTSLENELVRELRNFLEDEDASPRATPLMATIPEVMIHDYAKRHKINGVPSAPEDDVRVLLEELQEKQGQTKNCLQKSFAQL